MKYGDVKRLVDWFNSAACRAGLDDYQVKIKRAPARSVYLVFHGGAKLVRLDEVYWHFYAMCHELNFAKRGRQ